MDINELRNTLANYSTDGMIQSIGHELLSIPVAILSGVDILKRETITMQFSQTLDTLLIYSQETIFMIKQLLYTPHKALLIMRFHNQDLLLPNSLEKIPQELILAYQSSLSHFITVVASYLRLLGEKMQQVIFNIEVQCRSSSTQHSSYILAMMNTKIKEFFLIISNLLEGILLERV